MEKLKFNSDNKKYYSEEFIKGFECGVERQFNADMEEKNNYNSAENNYILENPEEVEIKSDNNEPYSVLEDIKTEICDGLNACISIMSKTENGIYPKIYSQDEMRGRKITYEHCLNIIDKHISRKE